MTAQTPYRLFSWELSYFSGKVRAYLRYKERQGDLGPGFEDVLATPDLVAGLLIPATGSGAVPQLLTPEGAWVQDSSEIIDAVEARHRERPVVPPFSRAPRQALACYLVELLADEWMVVPAFWERWYWSLAGNEPNHRPYNEMQWGSVFAAGAPGEERRAAGAALFESAFGISNARTDPQGVYAGLVHLGCTAATEQAWWASMQRILDLSSAHFAAHDFVLGGAPSLADFGLMGPLYAHLFRDATSGFLLRTRHPIVAEWVERTNGMNVESRTYGQKLYSLGDRGELIARPATSDGGCWLADDAVPPTLDAVVAVFFEEMWPMLKSTMEKVSAFLRGPDRRPDGELPGKTFFADPPWTEHQTGDGALTHDIEIGGLTVRRMVTAIHVWKLQRLASVLNEVLADAGSGEAVRAWLDRFPCGRELLDLDDRLRDCRVRKEGARLFAA